MPDGQQLELLLDKLCLAIEGDGYAIVDDALPLQLAIALRDEAAQLNEESLVHAGTGRNQGRHLDKQIRGDRISWLEPVTEASSVYLMMMDTLRQGINRRMYLGLFTYECHYARYEPGTFYKKHLDVFGGNRNRVLSTICYLNANWTSANKGELILYKPDATEIITTVLPVFNRMVVFMSERFPHEVLPTLQPRYSVAGWFRINPGNS